MIDRAGSNGRVTVLVLRKVGKTCRNSTFRLIREILEGMGRSEVHINRTEMSFRFPSGGEILHAGLDDVQKLKSISGVTHIWVEEATEMDFPSSGMEEPDLGQVDLRLRGVPQDLDPSITLTFNPTKGAKPLFEYVGVDTEDLPTRDWKEEGEAYVQHTTYKDNPEVGEEYRKPLERLPDAMRRVYLAGEIARVDDPDQVIPYDAVRLGKDLEPEDGLGYLGVDVARFGADKSVWADIEGNRLIGTAIEPETSTTRVANLTINRIEERGLNAENVGVDAVGIGAGVVDSLHDRGYPVQEIVSGVAAVDDDSAVRYHNLRSQMWWTLRRSLQEGRCALPYCPQSLVEELCAVRYTFQAERKIRVEPKEKTKQRLGRSPDEADAFVYGWALTKLTLDDSLQFAIW